MRDANSLSNDVRNAWSYTSSYEQEQARGVQLTGMNKNVSDLKFTSVIVNVCVRMCVLKFLSVYCCLFTSDIPWSLWMSRWSQWPRGLRRRSAATVLLRSWVRIPRAA